MTEMNKSITVCTEFSGMDEILCDELIQETFCRLPPQFAGSLSLVSKRWLRLHRASQTSLTLNLASNFCTPSQLSSFLFHFRFLNSLSIAVVAAAENLNFSDQLLHSVADSSPNLRHLRFQSSPVSNLPLFTLSTRCPNLTSLSISLSRPFFFFWLLHCRNLKHLSLTFSASTSDDFESTDFTDIAFDYHLKLESLHLIGIKHDDQGLDFLWRICNNLKKLQLRSCGGIGTDTSESSFINCLNNLQEIELRSCRTILDHVLSQLAETSTSLRSLLVYDGGSTDGLRQFINKNKSTLQRLDLRLPLDLDNTHLLSMAEKLVGLSTLKLENCCLVTGEGLEAISIAMDNVLEELSLVNCDVVEREAGLLSTVGQNLRKLKKLDLSYNDLLWDRELASMLISCNNLIELKLRGCSTLSNLIMFTLCKSCKKLENFDIRDCDRIGANGVEFLLANSLHLRHLEVEMVKVSETARKWASNRFIQII